MSVAISMVRANNPSEMTLAGTNTYVLTSRGVSVVVDPGPDDAAHIAAILAAADRVSLVISTHRHSDHTGAVDALLARAEAPARALDAAWCRDAAPLNNGEAIEFGDTALRVLTTPGHTSDSVCLLVPETGVLLTGDTVLGGSTTMVDYPDGSIADYLRSLELLASLGPTRILPGHGEEITEPLTVLRGLREHRLHRLQQLRELLTQLEAAASLDDALVDRLVPKLYPDARVPMAARRTVQAQLAYLLEQ